MAEYRGWTATGMVWNRTEVGCTGFARGQLAAAVLPADWGYNHCHISVLQVAVELRAAACIQAVHNFAGSTAVDQLVAPVIGLQAFGFASQPAIGLFLYPLGMEYCWVYCPLVVAVWGSD